MKERRSFGVGFLANETLISENRMLFEKISIYKGSRYDLLEKLKHFSELLKNLADPKAMLKTSWKTNLEKTENEISDFLLNTFESDYLQIEFSQNIPHEVELKHENSISQAFSGRDLTFSHLLVLLFNTPIQIKILVTAQKEFLDRVIECIESDGLLKSEIQKRNPAQFSRYHILFKISQNGKRKENTTTLFLTKLEVEEIFATLKNKGHAIINGRLIDLNTFDEVRISISLIKKEEEKLYRKKHLIRSDEEFIKSFQDVTGEFYNNKFLTGINPIFDLRKRERTMEKQSFNGQTKKIKALISADNIMTAISELTKLTNELQDKSLQNELLLLSAQFNKEEKNLTLGISKNKEERNRIIFAMLKVTDQIDEVYAEKSIVKNVENNLTKVRRTLTGYCIRTGTSIPFNPEKPLSYEAYKTWNQFGDPNYPEKFCHFSGEPSNGETSVGKPILRKNWQKAKEVHGF